MFCSVEITILGLNCRYFSIRESVFVHKLVSISAPELCQMHILTENCFYIGRLPEKEINKRKNLLYSTNNPSILVAS